MSHLQVINSNSESREEPEAQALVAVWLYISALSLVYIRLVFDIESDSRPFPFVSPKSFVRLSSSPLSFSPFALLLPYSNLVLTLRTALISRPCSYNFSTI